MRTRIYNARILTMEEKRPVFKGEIYIDGGKIFRIKEAKTEKSERTEKPACAYSFCYDISAFLCR